MTTNTEFVVPQEYIDLIIEIQDLAGWANQAIAWKVVEKIYDITTEFLEKEGLFEKE